MQTSTFIDQPIKKAENRTKYYFRKFFQRKTAVIAAVII